MIRLAILHVSFPDMFAACRFNKMRLPSLLSYATSGYWHNISQVNFIRHENNKGPYAPIESFIRYEADALLLSPCSAFLYFSQLY